MDLAHLHRFIEQDNPAAASRVAAKIIDASNLLPEHPLVGKSGRIHSTRELIVPGTPYTLVYHVEAEVVSILHVFHQARVWPHLLD
ncbi:MAG: type II toxin-antitoxin system RelE/ParE family toxin [Immundisolibacteraceae bacterium]|nr:type II toxin-antitoxin system RelE/ParE family toxin [Immundisolibacteraceae bacterium]